MNHGHTKNQQVQTEKIVKYTGKVYCFEVPNNTFYVRRNGKPVWTGNSARHGQKGTVGITFADEDLPYTSDGIRPDIIINPHAIPSRMTVGQLLECLFGQYCAIEGVFGDATPFTHLTPDEIGDLLHKAGGARHGKHRLYHGHTGKPMEHLIFFGPTYYQRLKHMVEDKIHARKTGPITKLTHQPVEGRARDGGLRFGEMERDAVIAHGASELIKERLFKESDYYTTGVCSRCGKFAQFKLRNTYICKTCNTTDIGDIEIPYAGKLFFQELYAMGITPRIVTKGNEHKFQYH